MMFSHGANITLYGNKEELAIREASMGRKSASAISLLFIQAWESHNGDDDDDDGDKTVTQ